MKKKFKYIFSLRLAGFLMMHGHRIIRINHNLDTPNKDVYVFIDTPELCAAMSEYTKIQKEKNNAADERSGSNTQRKND